MNFLGLLDLCLYLERKERPNAMASDVLSGANWPSHTVSYGPRYGRAEILFVIAVRLTVLPSSKPHRKPLFYTVTLISVNQSSLPFRYPMLRVPFRGTRSFTPRFAGINVTIKSERKNFYIWLWLCASHFARVKLYVIVCLCLCFMLNT